MEKSLTSVMDEIRERLGLLESGLPKRVDAMAVSPTSKLPFKVLLYREALIWRMAELARAAFENLVEDKLATAIVLTRAVVETSAALWYLWAKVAAAVESNAVGDIGNHLMKLVMGTATGEPATDANTSDVALPRPVRIGAFLKQVDKHIEGFSHSYGILSEYAHPNWTGTSLLYAKHDTENRVTDFGRNVRKAESTKRVGVHSLSGALSMFELSYNRTTNLIPAFIMLCESPLKSERDGQPTPG